MKDLTELAKAIESLVMEYTETTERPAVAVAFILGPDYRRVHWVTNMNRGDGIRVFSDAADNMRAEGN